MFIILEEKIYNLHYTGNTQTRGNFRIRVSGDLGEEVGIVFFWLHEILLL